MASPLSSLMQMLQMSQGGSAGAATPGFNGSLPPGLQSNSSPPAPAYGQPGPQGGASGGGTLGGPTQPPSNAPLGGAGQSGNALQLILQALLHTLATAGQSGSPSPLSAHDPSLTNSTGMGNQSSGAGPSGEGASGASAAQPSSPSPFPWWLFMNGTGK